MSSMINKRYAIVSPFIRLSAFLIDFLIISFIIYLPLIKDIEIDLGFSKVNSLILLRAIFASILTFLYFFLFEFFLNTTIGKSLFGLKIFKIKFNKKTMKIEENLNFLSVLLRNLFLLPFPFNELFFILDGLYMLFNIHKQRFMEKFSNTITLKVIK